MADSKVVKEQELTTDEVAKCKQGVCPNCGEELILELIITPLNEYSLFDYDKEQGKWVSQCRQLHYELHDLCCPTLDCDFTGDVNVIDKADIGKVD